MPMGAKINYLKYTLLSLVLLFAASFMAQSTKEIMALGLVVFAAATNHWMLVRVVGEIAENASQGRPIKKKYITLLVIGKLCILLAALSFGVHIMGSRVIIPVLIYVLQIAILYLSLENGLESK